MWRRWRRNVISPAEVHREVRPSWLRVHRFRKAPCKAVGTPRRVNDHVAAAHAAYLAASLAAAHEAALAASHEAALAAALAAARSANPISPCANFRAAAMQPRTRISPGMCFS